MRKYVWAGVLALSAAAWFLVSGSLSAEDSDAAAPGSPDSLREARASMHAPAARCPTVGTPKLTGKLVNAELDELSGMVASQKNPGVFWVHNDSGDDARAFAIDAAGRDLLELDLAGVSADDLEDIALMPGAGTGPDLLYLADIGDNNLSRRTVQLLRVEEPTVDRKREHIALKRKARPIDVIYEDGRHDAETLLADPRSGDLFLVSKSHKLLSEEEVGLYRLPAAELARGKVVARKVATLPLGPATGGNIAADGSAVIVRSYFSAFYWPRAAEQTVAQALSASGCRLPVADLGKQGEAITFASDGRSYLTVPEGLHAVIFRHPLSVP